MTKKINRKKAASAEWNITDRPVEFSYKESKRCPKHVECKLPRNHESNCFTWDKYNFRSLITTSTNIYIDEAGNLQSWNKELLASLVCTLMYLIESSLMTDELWLTIGEVMNKSGITPFSGCGCMDCIKLDVARILRAPHNKIVMNSTNT